MNHRLSIIRTRVSVLENRYRAWIQERPLLHSVYSVLIVFSALFILWISVAAYSILVIRSTANDLLELSENPDSTSLDQESVRAISRDVNRLDSEMHRLNRLTSLGLVEPLVYEIPVLGHRFEAVRRSILLGNALTSAASSSAIIGQSAFLAFEESGISWNEDNRGDTWLQAVDRQRSLFPEIVDAIKRAQSHRDELNTEALPRIAAGYIDQLDQYIKYMDELQHYADYYDDFFHAAGGQGTVRYLFLFQNPAELRPAGGFPGTFGLFSFKSGQLVEYEMFDSHIITRDYMKNRTEKLQQPWPFEQYAPQDGFILHDATWYANFPRSGQLMMRMWEETSWPDINGVIAIQPAAVSDMVRVTGPVEVDVDGEIRLVTEDNVYDEVERYRRLRFEGLREGELGDHKNILIDIGEAIMDEFKRSGGGDVFEAIDLLSESADRRDIQIYVKQNSIQGLVSRLGWAGELDSDPVTPTLAINFTNFVLEKASMAMDPRYDLHLSKLGDEGYRAVFHITLEHTGLHDQDHRYFGFQRWWIEAHLPNDAKFVGASHQRQPDPESPNGGSYTIDLFPEQTREMWISFDLPATERLMIRRQPGQVPPDIYLHVPNCDSTEAGFLTRDLYIDLRGSCPEVENPDFDQPRLLMTSAIIAG